jgi:ABC-2 type transport system ATP-binding protein
VSALQADGVRKTYGSGRRARTALVGCSFSADRGEVLGVIGPNGAGKTTLLSIVAGAIPASAGTVLVEGHRAGTRMARRAVGFASDPPLAPPELTGGEWLHYLASHRASSPRDRTALVRHAVEVAELDAFVARRIATYSRGMGQRLALAAGVVSRAHVLLLDETLAGVDPLVQRRLREQIARLASERRCVVVASHDLAAVERLATRVLVLWRGRLAADLSTARLLTERVAELALSGSGLAAADRVVARYPGALRTGQGFTVPLGRGLTVEQVLAVCREERVPVAAARVRYRALEDILIAAEAAEAGRV